MFPYSGKPEYITRIPKQKNNSFTTRLKMVMYDIHSLPSVMTVDSYKFQNNYLHNLIRSSVRFHWITWQDLPMIEYTLWESLSSGVGTQVGSKTKRLIDWKICFNYEHRCTSNLLFFKHVTSSSIKHTIDTTNGYFRALLYNFISLECKKINSLV